MLKLFVIRNIIIFSHLHVLMYLKTINDKKGEFASGCFNRRDGYCELFFSSVMAYLKIVKNKE